MPVKEIILIMQNHGYQYFRNSQRSGFSNRLYASDTRLSLDTSYPNLTSISHAYGLIYSSISSLAELHSVLTSWKNDDSPKPIKTLVEVVLSHEELLSPKCQPSVMADGSIISMPLEDMSPLLPSDDLEALLGTPLSSQSYAARTEQR